MSQWDVGFVLREQSCLPELGALGEAVQHGMSFGECVAWLSQGGGTEMTSSLSVVDEDCIGYLKNHLRPMQFFRNCRHVSHRKPTDDA